MKLTLGILLTCACGRLSADVDAGTWSSLATGTEISATVHPPRLPAEQAPTRLPVVVYLEGLAVPRVGTESDESILEDFQDSGYIVLILDYSGHPRARMPWINRDLGALRDAFRAGELLRDYRPDDAHIYLVPAGSRLLRDVVYYRDEERTLALDLIYPSRPVQPAGTVLEFSCDNLNRMGNASLSICSDTVLDAAATEGFAVAMADHPVAAPYKGIDAMPDCAWKTKAAVRTLRAVGARVGLNGRIVPVGFSRGSGMALLLVTTAGMAEFEGHGEHPDVSSAVDGAVVMSGRFTYLDLLPDDHMLPRYAQTWGERETHPDVWRGHGALDYLATAPPVPLFLTINAAESPDALHQMVVLRQRLATLGADTTFWMDREPRGHKVTLVPQILESMRRYLKDRLEP